MQSKTTDEGKQPLCYGSIIKLTISEDKTQFFVASEGFTSVNLELQSVKEIENQNAYLNSLFKIYPSFYNDEYLRA